MRVGRVPDDENRYISLFHVAGDGLFLTLIAFSSKKVIKKTYEPVLLFTSGSPKTSGRWGA